MDERKRRVGRLQFLGLVALFGVPLVAAMLWYSLAPQLAPPPAVHGTLIEPARPLEPFTIARAGGGRYGLEDLRGRWTLIHPVGTSCDAVCRQRLHYTRQIHTALGEDRIRVRRIALAAAGVDTPGLGRVVDEHPGLTVLRAGAADPLGRQLPPDPPSGTIFVVDPLGNLMMRFGPEVEPGDALEDLERLLKLSRVG